MALSATSHGTPPRPNLESVLLVESSSRIDTVTRQHAKEVGEDQIRQRDGYRGTKADPR